MENSKPITIAVDFDGTLVEDRYPRIGNIIQPMWDAMIKAQSNGCKLILWSSRNGSDLQAAVEFCANNGLHFDAINENLDETKVMYGGDTRKVFADVYIDDRSAAVTPDGEIYRLDCHSIMPARSCSTSSHHRRTHRICPECGLESDFDIVCPICKSKLWIFSKSPRSEDE